MKFLLVTIFLFCSGVSFAGVQAYEFPSQEQEVLYTELINELRCMVCQNQNIAGSNAELAQDLKRKTYQLVTKGKSKEEISQYMIERYGNFVLYKPPVTTMTFLLWFGPFVILIIAIYTLIKIIRGRSQKIETTVLSDEEKTQAEEFLKSK